jgi:hypothetical protein
VEKEENETSETQKKKDENESTLNVDRRVFFNLLLSMLM